MIYHKCINSLYINNVAVLNIQSIFRSSGVRSSLTSQVSTKYVSKNGLNHKFGIIGPRRQLNISNWREKWHQVMLLPYNTLCLPRSLKMLPIPIVFHKLFIFWLEKNVYFLNVLSGDVQSILTHNFLP